jgi:hypothetical protein
MIGKIFRWLPLLGLTLLVGSLDGCGSGSKLPCPIPTGMNAPGDGRVVLTLQNDTCMSICSFNLSPTACDDWGGEWLENRPVHSGESASFYVLPGRYDAMVEYCTQASYVVEKLGLTADNTLTVSGSSADNTPPCSTSLIVVNQSAVPICHMWIASAASQQFGRNWLRGEQLQPGDSRTFFVQPDTYDIKAEDCDFNLLRVELAVPVSGRQTWTVP